MSRLTTAPTRVDAFLAYVRIIGEAGWKLFRNSCEEAGWKATADQEVCDTAGLETCATPKFLAYVSAAKPGMGAGENGEELVLPFGVGICYASGTCT